jgi:hypothetical protein
MTLKAHTEMEWDADQEPNSSSGKRFLRSIQKREKKDAVSISEKWNMTR